MLSLGAFFKYNTNLTEHFGGVIGIIGEMPLEDDEINKSPEALQFQR